MPQPPTPTIPRPSKGTNKGKPTDPTIPTENLSGNGGNGGEPASSAPKDAPPRSRQRANAGPTGPSAPSAGGSRAPRTGQLETKLGEFFGAFSLVFAAAGDDYCAWVVASRSPQLASAWADLAKQNPAVKRVLEGLVEGSAWGGVIISSLAIALPIAKHHGLWRGPDPFSMLMPAPPEVAAKMNGNNNGNGNGGKPASYAWTKASGDAPAPQPTPSDDDSDYMSSMPGAPPGVVTVASTTAAHPGARQ
jgi:hypothetical protein